MINRFLALGIAILLTAAACTGEGAQAPITTPPPTSEPTSVVTTTTATTTPGSNGTEAECHAGDRNPEEPVAFEPADSAVPDGVELVALDAPVLDVAVGVGMVWAVTAATTEAPYRLIGIDTESMEVTAEVLLEDALKVAVGREVWITQMWRDTVVRVSPQALSSPSLIPMPPLPQAAALAGVDNCFGPWSIAVTDRGAWIDGRGVVAFVDAETEAISTVVPPSGELSKGGNVVVGFGSVWVETGAGSVWPIDEETFDQPGEIQISRLSGHSASSIAVGPELLWIGGGALERAADGSVLNQLASEGGGISTLDTTSGVVVDTIELDDFPLLATDGGNVMVAWEDRKGLWMFDSATLEERRLIACFEATVGSMAVTKDAAWLGHYDSGELWKVPLEESSSCPG